MAGRRLIWISTTLNELVATMEFYFSAYSTPLLFGFIQGWLYAILLWIRGVREERLSDKLLGWVLVALCFQIWMYMLGFGGIEVFWEELDFFPRTISFLLPPLVYFYLKSQFNTTFRFRPRDAWHALPFVIHWAYHIIVFAQGSDFVRQWQTDVHDKGINDLEFIGGTVQEYLYLYWSFQLYREYRQWIKHQFSETDTISFRWYRNFLIALVSTATFGLVVTLVDLWLNLSFWQDWWSNLAGAILIYYVSIEGYAQAQMARKLNFKSDVTLIEPIVGQVAVMEPAENGVIVSGEYPKRVTTISTHELVKLLPVLPDVADRLVVLLHFMATEKPYLEPELALPDLARRLHINPVVLSQVINAGAGKNFNDFVNEYRVEEFKRQVRDPANAHLSFLGLALDCGFNSKATFNRSFKKFTGTSPKEFIGN